MSENTKIEWATSTFSPWYGCTKVSEGCAHCYAEGMNIRFHGGQNWGKGNPRRKAAAAAWKKARSWNKRNPGAMVFPSQCDWLDRDVPIELLAEFLQLIHDTPHLIWQLLSKRPELFMERLSLIRDSKECAGFHQACVMAMDWRNGVPPDNVWVGASIENQKWLDIRNPQLLKIPAVFTFLSCEPLLGPIEILPADFEFIDWVIVGGESGPGARPCDVSWVRSIKEQCKAASTPVFVKQLGRVPVDRNDAGYDGEEPHEWPMGTNSRDMDPSQYQGAPVHVLLNHPKGGDMTEWPTDLRVREMP